MIASFHGSCLLLWQVHTEEHAMGSPGFMAMADMLTGAVHEAAAGLTGTGSGCHPCVQATCVQGCVQLLAGISITPGRQGYGTFASSGAIKCALEASLQELVQSRLVAMYAQLEAPAFEVTVASYSSCGSSSGTGTGGSSGPSNTSISTGSARLLSCSPPCLAAGFGSTKLLLDVHAACSVSGSDVGNARLVVWGSSGEVLVDAMQQLAGGCNIIRSVNAHAMEEDSLNHVCIATMLSIQGKHAAAFPVGACSKLPMLHCKEWLLCAVVAVHGQVPIAAVRCVLTVEY